MSLSEHLTSCRAWTGHSCTCWMDRHPEVAEDPKLARIAALEAENERLKVHHGDLIRCEGCEKTIDSVDAEVWHRTDDDCDLCPGCWAEFVAEARAGEGEVVKAR